MLAMAFAFIFMIYMTRRLTAGMSRPFQIWRGGMMCCSPPVRKNEGAAYPASDSAGAILDKRYVAGETNAEGYEEKKNDLNPT
jgi:hypothetical protein